MATSETPISGSNSADPAAATETVVYTSPTAGAGSVLSTIVACNRGGADIKVRIGISPGGGVLGNSEYIVFDHTVDANDALDLTLGITLAADDEVRVETDIATASFSVFGMELGS